MTNHSETTGSFENDAFHHLVGPFGPDDSPAHQVTLRTPAELAEALPYLLGYRPEDSIVLVALYDHGGRGRFGGRARLGIPRNPDDWPAIAHELARGLITGSRRRGAPPVQIVAYLCQEPAQGETGRQVKERLEPLAAKLRTECGSFDVPVIEALCISDSRYWSYICERECCPSEGTPMGLPGTSVLAAAAAYAGVQVRGTLRELRARLLPWETSAALAQEVALDTASMELIPRIIDGAGREVAQETVTSAEQVMRRLAAAPPLSDAAAADRRDDELLDHDEAAALILGLQDRSTRDRLAEWMEGDQAGPALRLWRALARRCVGPYGEHAAAPLALAGWVAWSTGDEIEAREALAMALGADPGYVFARLLHQAVNEGLDPESVRRCLRTERDERTRATASPERADVVAESRDSAEGPCAEKPSTTPILGLGDVTDADAAQLVTGAAMKASSRPGTAERRRRPGTGRARAGTHPRTARPAGTRPRAAGKAAARQEGAAGDDSLPAGADAEAEG
ncbi:DUF4192 domain-containing protein [Streptomyces sp. NPDC028635]|uniref:DUF4192 domain-containing protein n=1 Tax=Streptomyces sp. NPDC028635 TaxID=3154800 RepID=UPI0033D60F14